MRTAVRSLPVQCALLAGAFWLHHLWLRHYMIASHQYLGALRLRHLVPLIAVPDVHPSLWLVPGALIVVAFLLLGLRVYSDPRWPTRLLLPLSFAAFVVIGLGVSMIDGCRALPDGQLVPAPLLTYARDTEFYWDVPKIDEHGLVTFLVKYSKPAFFNQLALHSKTHPPGPVIFLWLVSRLCGYSLLSTTLATVLFGALAVWPVYWISRAVYGEAVGRMALPLYLLMPNVVLFSTTSMDAPLATVTVLALALFLKATRSPLIWAVAFGLALAVASFLTYASVFVPLFAILYSLGAIRESRRRWPHLMGVLAGAAITVIACYAILRWTTGFNTTAAVLASMQHDAREVGSGHESLGHYLNLSVSHLMAFFIGIGLPVTALWGRSTARAIADRVHGRKADLFVLAFLVSLILMAFSTLFTMEVERIWLFMAPCVVAPAAAAILQLAGRERRACFRWAMALLALQTLVFQTTLRTLW